MVDMRHPRINPQDTTDVSTLSTYIDKNKKKNKKKNKQNPTNRSDRSVAVTKKKHGKSIIIKDKGTYIPQRGQKKLSPNFSEKAIASLKRKAKASPKKG